MSYKCDWCKEQKEWGKAGKVTIAYSPAGKDPFRHGSTARYCPDCFARMSGSEVIQILDLNMCELPAGVN